MTDLLDIVEEPGPDVNKSNVFKHIWLSPTATFRYILKAGSPVAAGWLFVIASITALLKQSAALTFFNLEGNWIAVLLTLVLGAFAGWCLYQLYARIMAALAKRLGGKAGLTATKYVLAWSLVPYIASVVLILPQVLIFGFGLFADDKELLRTGVTGLLLAINALGVVLWLWSAVLLLRGLMTFNEFRFWKAFFCAALPMFVFLIFAGMGTYLLADLYYQIFD